MLSHNDDYSGFERSDFDEKISKFVFWHNNILIKGLLFSIKICSCFVICYLGLA